MANSSRIDAQQAAAAARQAAIEAARRAAEAAKRAAEAAERARKAQQSQAAHSKKNEISFQEILTKHKFQLQPVNGQTADEFQARGAAQEIADNYRIRTTPEACAKGDPRCGDPFGDGLSAQEGTAKKIRELTQNQTPEVAALTLKYAQPTIDAITAKLGETAKDEDGGFGDSKPRFDNVVSDLAAAANRAYTAPEGKAVVQQMAQSIFKNINPDDIGRFDEALVKPVKDKIGNELSAEVVRQLQAAGRTDQADDVLQNVRDDAKISVAEFNQTDGKPLDATQVQQLALQNAPILVLPPGSKDMPNVNLPADPEEYIENSRLRQNVPLGVEVHAPDLNPFNGIGNPLPVSVAGKDKEFGNNIDGDPNNNFDSSALRNAGEDQFLDLNNDKRGQIGSKDAPIFYQFERAKYDSNGQVVTPPKLTYHIFYGFNNGPSPVGKGTPIADHEGDWERVTYNLDPKTFQPTGMILSQHEGGESKNLSDTDPINGQKIIERDPQTNRPLVYVADGSHANYYSEGNDYPLPLGAKDFTATEQNFVKFDTARNLKEVTSQAWYPEPGSKGVRWGEIGALENEGLLRDAVKKSPIGQDPDALLPSGPQGPSYDKGAVNP